MTSRDGYCWTPKEGLKAGLPSVGVISPSSNISSVDTVYDVVVIGAGYSGLTAARNMAVGGLKVLLLEGRDRIGGRSWSSNIDGYPFEMGGTWVHWGQANTWHEVLRYQMEQDLNRSLEFLRGVDHFELRSTHESITMTHKEEERTVLEASILLASGGTLETSSFHEFMHWWAMCGYTYAGWMERLITWKFRDGQSTFVRRFFEEALATKRLSYAFNTPVKHIHNTKSSVQVTTRKGQTYRAHRAISTIPLNVLGSITFDPPLSAGKQAAIAIGHVNQTVKVHAEIANPELRSWTGVTYPHNKLNCAVGDGTTPAGNTHIVCFGGQHNHMDPEADIDATSRAVSSLFDPKQYGAKEAKIERIVFHNWSKDEFAKGLGSSRHLGWWPSTWAICANVMGMFCLQMPIGRWAGEDLSMGLLRRGHG
ncbi:hypothetical protein CFE70_000819 [Pyrenophora teres f. teres 0-1]